jgi:hypothetical protein
MSIAGGAEMGPPAPALGQSGNPNTNIDFHFARVRATITPRLPDNQSRNEVRVTAALAPSIRPMASEMNEPPQTF